MIVLMPNYLNIFYKFLYFFYSPSENLSIYQIDTTDMLLELLTQI